MFRFSRPPPHSGVCLHCRILSSIGPKSCQQKAVLTKPRYPIQINSILSTCVRFGAQQNSKYSEMRNSPFYLSVVPNKLFTHGCSHFSSFHIPRLQIQSTVWTNMWHERTNTAQCALPLKIKIHFFSQLGFSASVSQRTKINSQNNLHSSILFSAFQTRRYNRAPEGKNVASDRPHTVQRLVRCHGSSFCRSFIKLNASSSI